MKVCIAGYGSIGHYVAGILGTHNEILIYDPPLGYSDDTVLSDCDFVVVCVPTPSLNDGRCDTSLVEEIVSLSDPKRAIVCQSTISIGTIDRLIDRYGKPLVYVPEWAGESEDHPYRRLENHDFVIYGGYEPEISLVRALYEHAYGKGVRHLVATPRVAETVKYMENSFLALKVAFCNEFFDLCQAVGADFEAVRGLWLQDWRIGESHTTVTPERGYGGKCLPKDVAAVCRTGRDLGSPMEILEAVASANLRHRRQASTSGQEQARAAAR